MTEPALRLDHTDLMASLARGVATAEVAGLRGMDRCASSLVSFARSPMLGDAGFSRLLGAGLGSPVAQPVTLPDMANLLGPSLPTLGFTQRSFLGGIDPATFAGPLAGLARDLRGVSAFGAMRDLVAQMNATHAFLDPYSRWISAFVEAEERKSREMRRFMRVMERLQWPPTLRLATSIVPRVLALARRGVARARSRIESLIVEAHDEVLEDMERDWVAPSWIPERLRADVSEVFQCYRAGLFRGAVSTALTVVEALTIAAGPSMTRARHAKQKDFLRTALGGSDAGLSDRSALRYLLDVHYADFNVGDDAGTSPGRHPVLHGQHGAYGTKENALRVILILDYMREAFVFVAPQRSGAVHMPTCGVGRRVSRGAHRVFHSLAEATQSGLVVGACCANG